MTTTGERLEALRRRHEQDIPEQIRAALGRGEVAKVRELEDALRAGWVEFADLRRQLADDVIAEREEQLRGAESVQLRAAKEYEAARPVFEEAERRWHSARDDSDQAGYAVGCAREHVVAARAGRAALEDELAAELDAMTASVIASVRRSLNGNGGHA